MLPTWGAHQRLSRVVGLGRAKEMLLIDRRLDSSRSAGMGPARRDHTVGPVAPALPRGGCGRCVVARAGRTLVDREAVGDCGTRGDARARIAARRARRSEPDMSPSAEPRLLVSRPEPRVLLLTINRPEKRNALTNAMLQSLVDELTAAADADTGCCGSDRVTARVLLRWRPRRAHRGRRRELPHLLRAVPQRRPRDEASCHAP